MSVVKLRISGRVQGVGYRAWASRQAVSLSLSGWVRNRHDGSVEILLCGPDDAVATMIARCGEGPMLAHVTNIAQEAGEATSEEGFRQLPTL
ncbi:MAG: acylphosphatase [Pseudomonadota bacterium]